MVLDKDFNAFCNAYYKEASKVADITVAKFIGEHGTLNPSVDIDLAKDTGIWEALEKVYSSYDEEREDKASVKTYLSTIVHNKVYSALMKEFRIVHKKLKLEKPNTKEGLSLKDLDVVGNHLTKEELIAELEKYVKKLKGIDQVILYNWLDCSKKNYLAKTLEELGWEDTKRNRNVISVRCHNAFVKLKKKLADKKEAFLEVAERVKVDKTFQPKTESMAPKRRKKIVNNLDFDRLSASLKRKLSRIL